jgi:hypothetical protein
MLRVPLTIGILKFRRVLEPPTSCHGPNVASTVIVEPVAWSTSEYAIVWWTPARLQARIALTAPPSSAKT